MVSKPSTGYICGFEVYTGDVSGQSQGNAQELQDASKMSYIVLGLLDSVQLLDMGHHVYFNNYYNSPDLIDLLYKRKMHAYGTVRKNQKSLPLAVMQAKLKQGETVFCHKNNLLALKWMDKREVYILSGLHKATNAISKKTNYKGQKVTKPQPIFLYNRYISGVDLTDQFLQFNSFLHKSVKWSKKFFVYCLNMVMLNAHILHKKYSDSKTMHWHFRIELVKHMLRNAWQQPWGIVPVPDPDDCPLCLVEKHFIEPIPGQEGSRRKHPSCACFVYSVSKEALSNAGFEDNYKSKKYTSYWCPIHKHALCIDPCYRLYHTEKDYTSEIIKIARISVKSIQKDSQHV